MRKIPNDHRVTQCHSPFKQANLAGVNEKMKRMETEGYIIKLEKCDEDCFISPIVITRKKDSSIKLALDSKLFKCQPNTYELIDNVALQIS